MSARTAPLHRPSELALIGCDDRTNIAVFQVPSAHDANRINTTALDLTTGTILCDCKGAECGRRCWHTDLAIQAWHRTPAMVAARYLSDTALTNQGRKAAHMVAVYRQRIGRPLADDVIALVAARSEWRRRAALASPVVAVADLPLAA
jgi:hypothetical protein